jgi:peptidoglycan/xylan/chitin deacetylase (PgdA/CDA1 family)
MLSEVSQAQKDKGHHVFSHTWKIDRKDKHTHKTKHDHIQTCM